jgi:hypothetical protein
MAPSNASRLSTTVVTQALPAKVRHETLLLRFKNFRPSRLCADAPSARSNNDACRVYGEEPRMATGKRAVHTYHEKLKMAFDRDMFCA